MVGNSSVCRFGRRVGTQMALRAPVSPAAFTYVREIAIARIRSLGGKGEFLFVSAEVEEAILDKLRDSPHLSKHQLGSILKWLQLAR